MKKEQKSHKILSQFQIYNSMKFLIKFFDNTTKIVSNVELLNLESEALKLQGFVHFVVVRKLRTRIVTNKKQSNESNF